MEKVFPDTVRMTVWGRQPVALVLADMGGRSLPVLVDDEGVIFKVCSTGADLDLPVVSGLPAGDASLGDRLPAAYTQLFVQLRQLRDKSPSLMRLVSEVQIVAPAAPAPATSYDLLIYLTTSPVPVRAGGTLDESLLKYSLMVLDLLSNQGVLKNIQELDFRSGERRVQDEGGVEAVASEELIVGLDIGTTKVCAIIGEFNETGQLEIIGVGTTPSRGLRRGVVINIESTVKSIQNAVESAELMSGREVHGVYTGVAGGHIEGINSRGVVAVTGKDREITKEDVDRVIDAAKAIVIPMDREVLHVIPQEFIVDQQGGIKNPVGMVGVRLEAEAHIITGAVTSAQNIVKCVNRAGFKVNDIVLEPLASSKAVLTADERELGVLLIDLGGGTTDVLVHLEGRAVPHRGAFHRRRAGDERPFHHAEDAAGGGGEDQEGARLLLRACRPGGRRGRHPRRGRQAAAEDRAARHGGDHPAAHGGDPRHGEGADREERATCTCWAAGSCSRAAARFSRAPGSLPPRSSASRPGSATR